MLEIKKATGIDVPSFGQASISVAENFRENKNNATTTDYTPTKVISVKLSYASSVLCYEI